MEIINVDELTRIAAVPPGGSNPRRKRCLEHDFFKYRLLS